VAAFPDVQSTRSSGNQSPAIRLEGISKSFSNAGELLEVLKNVDLAVAEHAIFGLIGASGSGKSTLLNIISGIVKPDRGVVFICGGSERRVQ
jgi:ABC-type sugar transport system ATPase subunit